MASEPAAFGPGRARLEPAPIALSAAERAARGRAARAAVPRQSHAGFRPALARPDPVSLLEQQAASRLPELLPIRYGRMMASPFAFFRGAALPMASDLAATPATGLTVQDCGDAHLSNFGVFASPERRLVFDINDFDETLPGPWEWDVKRLAASIEVAARGNGSGRGLRGGIVLAAVSRYRLAMRALAAMGEADAWHSPSEVDELRERYQAILDRRERRLADADLARARDRAGQQALDRLTRSVDGAVRLAADPPLQVPVADLPGAQVSAGLEAHLRAIVANYRRTLEWDRRFLIERYQVADMARKVVGVGSVGMRCWIILLTGRDQDDRLFLQVKEAVPSVLSRFLADTPYPCQGERVVAGQRLMQAASDVFLGWHRVRGVRTHDYYVRQLRDWKFSLTVEDMDPAVMRTYAELCGQTLARGARPVRRPHRDRRLPGQVGRVRRGRRQVRRRLCRSERTGPRQPGRRGEGRPGAGRAGHIAGCGRVSRAFAGPDEVSAGGGGRSRCRSTRPAGPPGARRRSGARTARSGRSCRPPAAPAPG